MNPNVYPLYIRKVWSNSPMRDFFYTSFRHRTEPALMIYDPMIEEMNEHRMFLLERKNFKYEQWNHTQSRKRP